MMMKRTGALAGVALAALLTSGGALAVTAAHATEILPSWEEPSSELPEGMQELRDQGYPITTLVDSSSGEVIEYRVRTPEEVAADLRRWHDDTVLVPVFHRQTGELISYRLPGWGSAIGATGASSPGGIRIGE